MVDQETLTYLLKEWSEVEPDRCKVNDGTSQENQYVVFCDYFVGGKDVFYTGNNCQFFINTEVFSTKDLMCLVTAVTQAIIARECEVLSMAWSPLVGWQVWLNPNSRDGYRPQIKSAHKEQAIALLTAYLEMIETPAKV